jgi:glyoxylase-like metal-dependent hydrolase (beta-lactamase superfamily II)
MKGESPVVIIRNAAATAKINVTKLRSNVSVLEGSGGNIVVLTGRDGKVLVDAGITASRSQITEALATLSDDPVKHLINTHWHFDHTDGNEWLHSIGAEITAHENTRKHLSSPRELRIGISPSRRRLPAALPTNYSTPNKLCISTEQHWH